MSLNLFLSSVTLINYLVTYFVYILEILNQNVGHKPLKLVPPIILVKTQGLSMRN